MPTHQKIQFDIVLSNELDMEAGPPPFFCDECQIPIRFSRFLDHVEGHWEEFKLAVLEEDVLYQSESN